jgi:hypothetical protein
MTPTSTHLHLLAAPCAFGLVMPHRAHAEETPSCPTAFPAHTFHPALTSEGWLADTDTPAPLDSIGVFDGPPDQGALLKPWDATKGRDTWKLAPPYPQGLWIQCSYGNGALTLSRRLPTVPETCIAQ